MSVNFICGKPGGGKTLSALKLIDFELRIGNRLVVTNVAIRLDELNAYYQSDGIIVDLMRRIKILNDEEIVNFWKYREEGQAIFAVIDEAHLLYSAREWMRHDKGRTVLEYLSQHRKFGDDVILVTQHPKLVDVQLRLLAQDYTYVRNMKKEGFGPFRMPSVFTRKTYLEPFTGHQMCVQRTVFRVPKDLAKCYDTAAGVGIISNGIGDLGERRRGLPWQIIVVCVLVLGWCAWQVPSWARSVVGRQLGSGRVSERVTKVVEQLPVPVLRPTGLVVTQEVVRSVEDTNKLWVLGIVREPLMVLVSDGRVLRGGDKSLGRVEKNAAVVDGRRLEFR